MEIIKMDKEHYQFYAEWYHSAIRSIIDMVPFIDDYKWLANSVIPKITIRQAKQSVKLLLELGIIEKLENGTHRLIHKSITTGKNLENVVLHHFHQNVAELALHALDTLPVNERNITGVTLGISDETYSEICNEIEQFRKKIMNIAEKDIMADRTYQLNFQFFPISKEIKK